MFMMMNIHHGTSQLQACGEMIREADAGESVGVVLDSILFLALWMN